VLRKTIEADKPLQVHSREWQKIKVELGEGANNPTSSALVKAREIVGGRMGQEERTKSRLGETRDCSGAFELRMDFGFFIEDDAKNFHKGRC